MQLGEPKAQEQEAVCSLAFSRTGTLLLAGHAGGDVVFWEWHRTVWQSVKHVKGAFELQSVNEWILQTGVEGAPLCCRLACISCSGAKLE